MTVQVDTSRPRLLHRAERRLRTRRQGRGRRVPEGRAGAGALAGPARRPGGGRHVQPARLLRRLCGDQQGLPGALMSATLDLTAAERDRILAKSALFDPPPVQLADGRRDLVGLSRAELAAGDGGDRRSAVPRQAALALDLPPGRHRFLPHVVDRAAVAAEAGRAFRHRPARSGRGADQRGRRPANSCSASATGRRPRRSTSRIRAGRPRRGLHLLAGRLHAVLPLLPHRHAAF